MNTQNIILIFTLVSGTLLIIGSIVPSEPTDNAVNSSASTLNKTTENLVNNLITTLNKTTENLVNNLITTLNETIKSRLNQTVNDIKNHNTNQSTENQNDSKNQTPALSPDDPGVKAEFDRIAATPYDEVNYNCLNKSQDFQNYLLQHGATNTYVVRIMHSSGSYMHAFIVWNGRAYDPTNEPPYYGVDYNEYIEALNEQGFTTVISQM